MNNKELLEAKRKAKKDIRWNRQDRNKHRSYRKL